MLTAERRPRINRSSLSRGSTRRRRGYDPQPRDHAEVLIASIGGGFTRLALEEAVTLVAGGQSVAVLAIARVYGSSFGFPNPGLMPTRREMQACTDELEDALAFFRAQRVPVTGQIAVTRREVGQVVAVARARTVAHVVLSKPGQARWREVLEGDPVRTIRRRLGSGVSVQAVRERPQP